MRGARRIRLAEDQLAAGESLGVVRPALHAAEPGEREERLLPPPVPATLRWIALVQQLDLAPGDIIRYRQVYVWPAKVPIPLRDFITKYCLVTEGRRDQPADGPVVLVRVVRRRREDDVRPEGSGRPLKNLLDLPVDGRKPPVGQVMQVNLEVRAG